MSSDDMTGRVCLVTGANSGLGFATSEALARMGAHIVMVCRNSDRGEAARSKIKRSTGRESGIDMLLCDLSSLQSIRELAQELLRNYSKINILVNNAGLFNLSRKLTVDNYENTFAVNYLSQFLLTNLLLNRLVDSSPSRVIIVSSTGHYSGHINFDDLQAKRGYGGFRAYSQSKLAQIVFTHELAKRLQGTRVTVNSLHPGTVGTNIWSRPAGKLGFVMNIFKPFLTSPDKGAETIVYLATSRDVESVSGEYFEKKHVKKSSRESYDSEVAQRLWNVSSQLTYLEK
jgi:retinol dehydrogenase 12